MIDSICLSGIQSTLKSENNVEEGTKRRIMFENKCYFCLQKLMLSNGTSGYLKQHSINPWYNLISRMEKKRGV